MGDEVLQGTLRFQFAFKVCDPALEVLCFEKPGRRKGDSSISAQVKQLSATDVAIGEGTGRGRFGSPRLRSRQTGQMQLQMSCNKDIYRPSC
jgi:hypothetical protein